MGILPPIGLLLPLLITIQVHKSFRSQNVIFFPSRNENGDVSLVDYNKPWIFGFEYSRPENDFTFGAATNSEIEHDIYRHPERQGVPSKPFSKLHDIYALGSDNSPRTLVQLLIATRGCSSGNWALAAGNRVGEK